MGTKKRRRGSGEGAIYQRSDGYWAAAVSHGWKDGKRQRKVIYGKTRKEVGEKLKSLLAEKEQDTTDASETTGAFLESWLQHVTGTVRPLSAQRYGDAVRLHLVPALGAIPLHKLTARHVQEMLTAKLQEGLGPVSVRYIRTVLRIALNQAVRWEAIEKNVANAVTPPAVDPREATFLTQDQARQLLDAVRGDKLEAMYTVALAIGLRLGEITALRWEDIDLETGRLQVKRSIQRINSKLVSVTPKTDKARRTIELPAVAIAALRQHRFQQATDRTIAGSRWKENGLVFTSSIGTPMSSDMVWKRFQVVLERAGLPPMRFHDLRHSCASLLLAQNVPIKTVQAILGHATIVMTMETYGHLLPGAGREAADQMDVLLRKRRS